MHANVPRRVSTIKQEGNMILVELEVDGLHVVLIAMSLGLH